MSMLDAVEIVLTEAGTPLSYRDITSRIMEGNLWQIGGKTPAISVNGRLSKDIEVNGSESRFQRIDRGLYDLRVREASVQSGSPMVEQTSPPVEPPTTNATPTKPLSFADAAEWVLDKFGHKQPMHYRDITNTALKHGAVATASLTPDISFYGQIRAEIERQQQRGETPRFVKQGKGIFGLTRWAPVGLASQIEQHNRATRAKLRERLLLMSPKEFEMLISQLLVAIGFEDVQVTPYSGDGGIDVSGTLVVADVIRIHMAVQVKRWKNNVQAPIVQQVRGSLGTHDQGLIITTSDFSSGAIGEAKRQNAIPVALMNGEQLVALLVEHGLGVRRTPNVLLELSEAEDE